MPTCYPPKNSVQQIFVGHLQRTEITKISEAGMLPSRIQETHNPVQNTGKSTIQNSTVTLEIMMCSREKKSTERKEMTVLLREIRGKQKKKANKQKCLKIRSSMVCVLTNKYFGNPFFISRSIFGGATRHACAVSGSNGTA